jgi:hypothetical protein
MAKQKHPAESLSTTAIESNHKSSPYTSITLHSPPFDDSSATSPSSALAKAAKLEASHTLMMQWSN